MAELVGGAIEGAACLLFGRRTVDRHELANGLETNGADPIVKQRGEHRRAGLRRDRGVTARRWS